MNSDCLISYFMIKKIYHYSQLHQDITAGVEFTCSNGLLSFSISENTFCQVEETFSAKPCDATLDLGQFRTCDALQARYIRNSKVNSS